MFPAPVVEAFPYQMCPGSAASDRCQPYLYRSTSFFHNSGVDNLFVISKISNVVNVLSTLPGLCLVEKWGKCPLLILG